MYNYYSYIKISSRAYPWISSAMNTYINILKPFCTSLVLPHNYTSLIAVDIVNQCLRPTEGGGYQVMYIVMD